MVPSFLGTKKKGVACGDFDGMMHPVFRCLFMKALQAPFSAGLRGYTFTIFGTKESWSSMVRSNEWWGGRTWYVFSEKTSAKLMQNSGTGMSLGPSTWASWVEVVILLTCLPIWRWYSWRDQSSSDEQREKRWDKVWSASIPKYHAW